MKIVLTFLFFTLCNYCNAQKIESIHANLYTDSLKKGTYNYINIDGQLSNGKYLPLDSNYITLVCTSAKFVGNSLVIPADFKDKNVTILVTVIKDPSLKKEFVMWVKQMEDPPLKTLQEKANEVKVVKNKKRNKAA